ncbi:hypothetical protein [Streptomyces sp. NBC_01244]|uniref:hypothetical protein n=1 Tax=Streptomyces sp. NBC_01244 TaxID=2903797 RepID=UPI002E0E982C|nr:hypothetical protein OG247_37715 [Streptomyces sp. NBC_01244]
MDAPGPDREEAEAARWGMTGSPTVLLDGLDPFAVAGAPASVSCRLYRDEDGRADGAPSVQALRQALAGAIPASAAGGRSAARGICWTRSAGPAVADVPRLGAVCAPFTRRYCGPSPPMARLPRSPHWNP